MDKLIEKTFINRMYACQNVSQLKDVFREYMLSPFYSAPITYLYDFLLRKLSN